MKKIFLVLLMLIFSSSNAFAQEPKEIYARGAVLIDMKTGRVLWERKANEPMAVASTTKIMTALIALEKGDLDGVAIVSQKAEASAKVKLGLNKNEEYRLKDLLYPLMLESSNDAAVVIAETVAGSVEEFAEMMNDRARSLGANNTNFVTPNGLDQDGNHSTAYDMALIATEALKNQEFINIINTPEYSFKCLNKEREFKVTNKNRFLKEFVGAIGVKTGFTGLAGHCFVGAATREDETLISVVLGSGWGSSGKEKKWTDTKKLLNYGFDNFYLEKVLDKNQVFGKTLVLKSEEGQVNAIVKEDGYAMITTEEKAGIKVKAKLKESAEAPVKKGDVLGQVWVETDTGEELFRTDLIAENDIKRKDFQSSCKKIINNWLNASFEGIIYLRK